MIGQHGVVTSASARVPRWASRTVRSGVYLVLGGIIAAGYAVLVVGIVQLAWSAPAVPPALTIALALLSVPLALAPPLLAPVRDIGIAAARSLLDVDLPTPTAVPTRDDRLRSAGFFAAHLLIGGVGVLALLFGVPYAVGLIGWALGARGDGFQLSAPDLGGWGVLVALAILAALPPLALLGGAVLRALAVPLLGPGSTEREAEERRRRLVLAERNLIARELHDGVGHALAVTTMQAGVAEAALATDEAAARAALAEIGRVGRQAMADLDRSLAVLREEGVSSPTAPPASLADLDGLREQAVAVGQQLRLVGDPATLTGLDPFVSREAHQLLVEAVVNARRHGVGDAEIRWQRDGGDLVIEVSNAVDSATGPRADGGRGLIGMHERAALIGADLAAGPDGDGRWSVRLTIGAS